MRQNIIPGFLSGTHNLIHQELAPEDSALDSLNWITRDGKIQLTNGRTVVGAEGAAGKNYGEHTGYRVDGTAVRFRKVGSALQYLNGSTWTDVVTGLTESDVTFANYQSLAGAFVYVFSPDDGIIKICTANPGNYVNVYSSAKNFKGYGIIEKGRTYMWGVEKDPTGLYGSWIDVQDSNVYTSVSSEVITDVSSGTLAFKAGGATRTCFAVQITDTSSGEVFTDDYNGNLVGSLGSTGTINYMTGAFTITGQSGAGTADYQWEDSNAEGVTDFTKSASRVAGEGFIIRQDDGGDKIRTVVAHDGTFISLKARSAYRYVPDPDDVSPINELIRSDIGVTGLRGAVATSAGVVFLNVANPTKPVMQILEKNPFGDNFNVRLLFQHYDFSKYAFDDATLFSWDRYILLACQLDSNENNVILLCDVTANTVDKIGYGARSFTKNGGYVYAGDPVSKTTYELFTGFDDVGLRIENSWTSAPSLLKTQQLKKVKRLRFMGEITPDQSVEVWVSRDNSDWLLVGTIRGDGDYVDYSASYAIGTTLIGSSTVGGDDEVPAYRFFMEIKLLGEKFRQRRVRFIAKGVGYVAMQQVVDHDIILFENRLPKSYRSKQNVSIDGTTTNNANAQWS